MLPLLFLARGLLYLACTMKRASFAGKLFFTSLVFLVLLNYPLIQIVNKPVLLGGIPLLYLYIFIVWILMILALYRLFKNKHD